MTIQSNKAFRSGNGPSRHFAASQNSVAIGGIADIGCGSDWMPRWRMTRSGHEQVSESLVAQYYTIYSASRLTLPNFRRGISADEMHLVDFSCAKCLFTDGRQSDITR